MEMTSDRLRPTIPPLQWSRVCSDCWQELNLNEYLPESSVDYGICHVCLQDGTLHGVRTRELQEWLDRTGFDPTDDTNLLDDVQALINRHTWGLEGSVGRAMMRAIEDGEAVLGLTPTRDYWGSYIPSRFEVKRGTKGSVEYMLDLRSRQ